uniref:Uncharacterized protein n=1 Tax=Gasterosteus aculeatus aculeatus TaxID=481459 RepID=A0AAQ4Q3F2_GASAC
MWTGGSAEDEWEELLMDGKRSPFLLLYSWRLLGRPYLLLIRYGAVSIVSLFASFFSVGGASAASVFSFSNWNSKYFRLPLAR